MIPTQRTHLPRAMAFSLVELLVVMAIISILMALLLPVLAKARAAAHRACCASNQRNIYLAQQLYCDDHDDIYACHSYDPDQGWFGYNSALIMLGYCGTEPNIRQATEALFYCPTKTLLGNRWPYGYREGDYGINYPMRSSITGVWSNPIYPYFKRRFAFRPSRLYLTGDVDSQAPGNGKKLDGYNTEPRHDKAAVIVCHDGHVLDARGPQCYQAYTGWGKLPWYNTKE